jgi:hypothetical protein
MNLQSLPERFANCPLPIPDARRAHGDVLPSEESASIWLWAWPSLLGWPRCVEWLFSPVVGNSKYPGDLWGLDDAGNLLIVETKVDRPGARQNPLQDFLGYATTNSVRQFWSATALARRWRPLLDAELAFLKYDFRKFDPASPPTGKYPGVLPYSRHRIALWRWSQLYRELISPRFVTGECTGSP